MQDKGIVISNHLYLVVIKEQVFEVVGRSEMGSQRGR